MKKKLSIIAFSTLIAVASVCLWGCSDDFLEEKTDYGKLTPDIYNDYTGALMRVQDIYLYMLPQANAKVDWRTPGGGGSDVQTQATEEYAHVYDASNKAESFFIDPEMPENEPLTADYFQASPDKMTSKTPWGYIRNCNDVIAGIEGGTLKETQKRELLGQVYFFRAWQYFLLVQRYGGVPIIKELQAANGSAGGELQVPRATTKECIDFICADMQKAASMLPATWPSAFGRVTRGAALAVAARARLLYASPLFNRADDDDRWQAALVANKAAYDTLMMDGFGLYQEAGPNGAGFAKMFSEFNPTREGVFVTMYNKVHDDDDAFEYWRNNTREQGMRPRNAGGSGGTDVTQNMVDLFPMADGKKPDGSYNPLLFFKNRDPRFYRTFAFPGVRWRQMHGDPKGLSDYPEARFADLNYDQYVLWNYTWYSDNTRQNDPSVSGFGADKLGENVKGVYLRKRCQDFDVPSPHASLIRFPASMAEQRAGDNLFREGAFPHMEIRFAEVMLNYAEALCGAGQPGEAIALVKQIRERAGYDAAYAPDYGITAATRAEVFAAILYERQIEFAYEGKRFYDMRRWMLWDGGVTQPAGAPGSWTLTGNFASGTCAYLGVEPLNGKRRDRIVLHAKTNSPEQAGDTNDPLFSQRPAPLDLRKPFSEQTAEITALENFYTTHLVRKTRTGDKPGLTVQFTPKMYFLGFIRSAQEGSLNLEQNIGWPDVNKGSIPGTFDPLAE